MGTYGDLGGQKYKSIGKLSNGWTDWHQVWLTSAYSSGNGPRLNTSRPSIPQGVFRGRRGFRGSQIQVWESCQTAGPIDTKFGTRLWIHPGMNNG